MNKQSETVHIIACGVLAVDLKEVVRRVAPSVQMHFLPGGLHKSPVKLRKRLQETIDSVSAKRDVSRIVIGYGVCGRGSVGIRARAVPLVIPRVHDCIALFLGSDARYREQFAKAPGTYYISAGWVEETSDEGSLFTLGSDGDVECGNAGFRHLTQSYGAENAEHIRDFLESWKRNYTRAAFIDSGVGEKKQRYRELAQRMAQDCGWHYEQLDGSHDLLAKALTATATTDEILVVPPDAITEYDAIHRRLEAVPVSDGVSSPQGTESAPATPDEMTGSERRGMGLGIDAGGTYTDAVLFDFDSDRVLAKAKALTTPWDYTLGIREALAKLDADMLPRVRMTGVSTTLATNAIVEGRGQKTGLLVMPPYGWRENLGFQHKELEFIDGRLEIDGTELQPVDHEQVRRIVRRMVDKEDVAAFAVGGYASHANPAHELEVREIIEAETGLGVTCAHELSEGLNYRLRAETAALNARIIPCLTALLDRLASTLTEFGVTAPTMIVRSDGSLMSLPLAQERPLETMLSGPAASVAGAAWLAGVSDALVVDVGGTTTDTAVVRGGVVELCDEGATIGGWQTHIRALNLRTLGLGGDSHIHLDRGTLMMGPERVGPIAWLAATWPGTEAAFEWIENRAETGLPDTQEIVLYARVGSRDSIALTEAESQLLDLLDTRPHSAGEAAAILGKLHFSLLPWKRLVDHHILQRFALTPTDALHAAGLLDMWDGDAAARACNWMARVMHRDEATFARSLIRDFERLLATELLKKQMDDEASSAIDDIDSQPAALALLDRALDPPREGYQVRIELQNRVVGVGAPAGCFVPGAVARLHAESVVPEHADVANAVGAIIGTVSFRRQVTVATNEQGIFRLDGVPNSPLFTHIDDATAHGQAYLRRLVKDLAQKAGALNPQVHVECSDSTANATEGQTVFISRTLHGWACGQPGSGQ